MKPIVLFGSLAAFSSAAMSIAFAQNTPSGPLIPAEPHLRDDCLRTCSCCIIVKKEIFDLLPEHERLKAETQPSIIVAPDGKKYEVKPLSTPAPQ